MEIRIKTRGCAVAGLLGAAAGALAILVIVRRLPDLMSGMMRGMMSEMMKGMEPGTMPDM
jgi:hypothetical protein